MPSTDKALSATALLQRAGITPDPWQTRLLQSDARRAMLLCSRQSGKSTATAAMVLSEALWTPNALVMVVCPSLRQSKEFLSDKVLRLYTAAGRPMDTGSESTLHLTLSNRSRILALPGNEATLRGFSGASLIVLDEAARIPDKLYYALRPILAVSGGRLLALSTPFGKRGWFYEEWEEGGTDWHRVKVTADQCPRITPEFLEEERRRLPGLWLRAEYFCEFNDSVNQVFATDVVDGAFTDYVEPLFPDSEEEEEDLWLSSSASISAGL